MRKNYLKALAIIAGILTWSGTTNAQYFTEGFESGTFPAGWVQSNVAKPWLIGPGSYMAQEAHIQEQSLHILTITIILRELQQI